MNWTVILKNSISCKEKIIINLGTIRWTWLVKILTYCYLLLQDDNGACRKLKESFPNHISPSMLYSWQKAIIFLSQYVILCYALLGHDLWLWHHCSQCFSLTSIRSKKRLFGMATLPQICVLCNSFLTTVMDFRWCWLNSTFHFGYGDHFRCHNQLHHLTSSLNNLGFHALLCFIGDIFPSIQYKLWKTAV